jgi:hypothetical protein
MSKVDHRPSVTPHLDTLLFRGEKHPEYMKILNLILPFTHLQGGDTHIS